jgi:hypothetical protein
MMKTKTQPKVDHTPAELDDLSRMLLKAASLIEERGHWRGGPSIDGSTCAVLALQVVGTESGGNYLDAVYRLCKSLHLNTKGHNLGTSEIYKWNDSHVCLDDFDDYYPDDLDGAIQHAKIETWYWDGMK